MRWVLYLGAAAKYIIILIDISLFLTITFSVTFPTYCTTHLCFAECVQVWLPKPATAAAPAVGLRCSGGLFAPAAGTHWGLACSALSGGGLLPAAVLLPLAISALDLLQEGPWAAEPQWPSTNHHARLFPPEPPRFYDAQLAYCGGIPGLPALQICQVLPHASSGLPQGLSDNHQRPGELQLPWDAVHPSGLPHTRSGRGRRDCTHSLRPGGWPDSPELHGAARYAIWLRLWGQPD